MIGMSNALDMILTGRPVSAQEAKQMGLANRVVPKGQARQAAEALVSYDDECNHLTLHALCFHQPQKPTMLTASNQTKPNPHHTNRQRRLHRFHRSACVVTGCPPTSSGTCPCKTPWPMSSATASRHSRTRLSAEPLDS